MDSIARLESGIRIGGLVTFFASYVTFQMWLYLIYSNISNVIRIRQIFENLRVYGWRMFTRVQKCKLHGISGAFPWLSAKVHNILTFPDVNVHQEFTFIHSTVKYPPMSSISTSTDRPGAGNLSTNNVSKNLWTCFNPFRRFSSSSSRINSYNPKLPSGLIRQYTTG